MKNLGVWLVVIVIVCLTIGARVYYTQSVNKVPDGFNGKVTHEEEYIYKNNIAKEELHIKGSTESIIFKVKIVDEYKMKDSEMVYLVEFLNTKNYFNCFNFEMTESEYKEKIGEDTNSIKMDVYELNVECAPIYNTENKSYYIYDESYYRYAIKGEEPFNPENSKESIDDALRIFNKDLNNQLIGWDSVDEPLEYTQEY